MRANWVNVFIILRSVVEGRSSLPAALAAGFRFVHSNGRHPSHGKPRLVADNIPPSKENQAHGQCARSALSASPEPSQSESLVLAV
jgi:hypothetical protein